VFNAETAYPQHGDSNSLSVGYDMRVSKDSVVVFLPYYGRAYVAPNSSEGGIAFTSPQFEYAIQQQRNFGWNI